MKMRIINAGFLIAVTMLADEVLCRFYMNDDRVKMRWDRGAEGSRLRQDKQRRTKK